MKPRLKESKEEMDNSIIIIGGVTAPLSIIDQTPDQRSRTQRTGAIL